MTERKGKQITEREIREAELQMTGRPPSSATGFIGFVPAAPTPAGDGHAPAANDNGNAPVDKD